MARTPRFIEDDEPVVRRGRHIDEAERKLIEEVDRLIAEDDAPAKSDLPAGNDFPEEDDTPVVTGTRFEEDKRFENDDDGSNGGKKGKKIALIIVALLLGFAIIGAGVYALVHFVLMPDQQNNTAATEFSEPTIPQEPTLVNIPTQAPTQAPTEAPKPDYEAMADTYMKGMSDYEKLCQLFIVTPEVLTAPIDQSDDGDAVTVAGAMTEKCLEDYPVGGIIYFADNLTSTDQTEEMIANSQKYAKTPLFIAVDEEGGDVARVAEKLGTKKFKPMFEYKDEGEEVAHDNAEVIGSNLRAIGFNMDNAPVADVLTNPDNTVIGDRAYSDDFATAAKLVSAAVKGYKDSGVISVLKHFPGHGGTADDSHDGLAYIDTSVEDLKKGELLPFKAGIEAGADMVMVGHLIVSDLDPDMPATLSSEVVPELLRKELGYNGIVISDSMSMGAITYDYDTTVKGLFAADIDIILQPDDIEKYIEAIQNALESGDITQAQIDAKVKKIIAKKYEQGIMKASAEPVPGATEAPSEAGTQTVAAPPAPVNPTVAAPVETPSVAA